MDCGLYFVAVLSAWAASAGGFPVDISVVQVDLSVRGLGQDGNGDCAGLDSPVLLCGRYALPAMAARLVGKGLGRSSSGYAEGQQAGALVGDFRAKGTSEP